MDQFIPWLGIGALVAAGYMIHAPEAKQDTKEKNSKSGPPFYDAATTQPLRNTGYTAIRAAMKTNSHNPYGNNSADVQRFQEFVREESEAARLRQWMKATDRQEGIVVQPNSRKVVYVNKW